MSRRNLSQGAQLLKLLLLRSNGKLAWRRLVVVVVLLAAYLFLQPWLNRSLGIHLPSLGQLAGISEEASHEKGPESSKRQAAKKPTSPTEPLSELADILREVGPDVYESPAGLRYRRGSIHGHRLKHVLAHAQDKPNRPGQHGVFDTQDVGQIVQLLDEAYQLAQAGKQTRTVRESPRTIHTVNLGRRIGYIGGESGSRRSHPAASHLRLVLEKQNVITAFPVRP